MPNPATPSAPTPAGDDRNLIAVDENYIAPTFEDRLALFWEKNSKAITALLIVLLLIVAGKGAWEYIAAQKERGIGQAYAGATTPVQLKSFVAENPKHPLAGLALLRVADEAYAGGQFADAILSYDQGATILKTGPLASRARLGSAMAKLQSGKVADGEAALKTIAADVKEITAYRAEASYHLASQAAAGGNTAEVKAYSDQLMQLDPASPWTQRALALRSSIGVEDSVPMEAMPTITLPGTTK